MSELIMQLLLQLHLLHPVLQPIDRVAVFVDLAIKVTRQLQHAALGYLLPRFQALRLIYRHQQRVQLLILRSIEHLGQHRALE